MRNVISLLAVAVCLGAGPAFAESDKPDLGPQVTSKRGLTPEEKAEKEARKACKIEICDILATKEQTGPDVACDIGWTWRKAEIVETLDDRIEWPWGKAVCQSKIRMKRAPLARAMSEPHYTLVMDPLTVRCTLDRKDGEPYVVEIEMAPELSFKNGEATKATMNWGDVSAPKGIYPLLYAGTGLDNSTNLLGPEAVDVVNQFIDKDCADVNGELPGRRVN